MIYDIWEEKRIALIEYPQFAHTLIPAMNRGWKFVPPGKGHEVMKGYKLWPAGWADAILIRSELDVYGHRIDPSEMRVWSQEGSLIAVMGGLLELPDPDQPYAPRLVVGYAPRLWTP